MSFPIAFRRRARIDLIDALLWHEDQRAGLGSELDEDFDSTLALIRERPTSFPSVGRGARRALTKRFSYAIYFKQQPDVIYVLAVVHTSRSQSAWKRRLSD